MKKHAKHIIFGVLGLLLLLGGYIFGYTHAGVSFLPPHYHANFAIYIDGERIDFSGDQYMEDVAGCSLTGKILPKDRAHLHENNPDTIHIHAEGVSWGHFFANLGFVFDSQFLSADNGQVFQEDGDKEISYVLNGEKVKNPFNTLIRSEDRLLISYGDEGLEERMQQYETVSSNAGDYNSKYDPGSCGGTNENGVMILLRDRLHALMGHEGH